MKKILTLAGMFFIISLAVNAQNTATVNSMQNGISKSDRCGNDKPDQSKAQMLQDKIFNDYVALHRSDLLKNKTAYTIPVVVHIIYKTAAENISDQRVLEQITRTNSDFAGLSTHSMGPFSDSLEANSNITFCLATIDPSGNPTTGITRTQTTKTSFNITGSSGSCSGFPERCASSGGCDAWNVTKYLNIWVCNTGTTMTGISEYPSSPNNAFYGSTINYMFFGLTGATPPYNEGATLTHELGHCFNLYHLDGDNTCTDLDYCLDTPTEYGTQDTVGGCIVDQCNPACPGIMNMNFMAYSIDTTMVNFTPDQVARMQACVTLYLSSVAGNSATACSPPAAPIANYTASATSVIPGTVVNFTDLTVNTPTSWSWVVTPSTGCSYTGGTNATSKNPRIKFFNAGYYSVSLTAVNTIGSNNCTKINYIQVLDASQGCDTVMPASFNAGMCNPIIYPLGSPVSDSGYISGSNALLDKEKAMFYSGFPGWELWSVIVNYGLKAGNTGNTFVRIYNSNAGFPGVLLGTSDSISKNDIDTSYGNNSNYFFANNINVTNDFFVSLVLPTTWATGTEELAIWSMADSCSSNAHLAYEKKSDGSWIPFVNTYGRNIDMAIFPQVCISTSNCSANFSFYPDTVTLHHYYAINLASGVAPLHYLWSWGDGTTDTIAYPSHTYAAAGYYNICLSISDSVGCTNSYCDSSYIQKSGNTVISVDVIPQGSAGIHEFDVKNIFNIYPVPATENIIVLANTISQGDILSVFDIRGQLLIQIPVTQLKTDINISAFSKGIYFLKLEGVNGIEVKKFFKE